MVSIYYCDESLIAMKKIIVSEGKFLRLVKKGEWEYVERHNCTGIVIIVALTHDHKVILVEQYRPPVDKKVIEFPAGLINDECANGKEDFLKAAERELLEETGYKAKRLLKVAEGPVSAGMCSDKVTMVRAVGARKVAQGGGNESESIVVHEVSVDKIANWLKKMERKGYLIEPKIYAGLYFLREYNEEAFRKKETQS